MIAVFILMLGWLMGWDKPQKEEKEEVKNGKI